MHSNNNNINSNSLNNGINSATNSSSNIWPTSLPFGATLDKSDSLFQK